MASSSNRPTVADIASRAGVSKATVSHALNDSGRVRPATRQQIRRIAEELGYATNVHARNLATGRHMTVALQVSGHRGRLLLPDSAYYIAVLNSAASTALRRGFLPVLTPTDLSEAGAAALAVDGAFVIDPTARDPLLASVLSAGGPVVTAGRPLQRAGEVSWADNDHHELTIGVLEHLLAAGYERPAVLMGTASRSYAHDTVKAYREWVRGRELPEFVLQVNGVPTADRATAVVSEVLASSPAPDAIYAAFDVFALGALRAAEAAGLSVPTDLGIVSTMDSDVLRSVSPTVTAYELHSERIGQAAMSMLIDQLEGDTERRTVFVPSELQERGSTARFARAGDQRAA